MGFGKAHKQARNRRIKMERARKDAEDIALIRSFNDDEEYAMEHEDGTPMMGGAKLTGVEWKEFYRDYYKRYRGIDVDFSSPNVEV